MEFTVNVNLGSDDAFLYTPDAAAAQVIAALGGDPTKDYCTVYINQMATGTAGAVPAGSEIPPPTGAT